MVKGVARAAVAKGAARVVEVTAAAEGGGGLGGWRGGRWRRGRAGARAAVVKAVVTEVVDTAAGARVVAVTEAEADRAVARQLFPPLLLKQTPARLEQDRIGRVSNRARRRMAVDGQPDEWYLFDTSAPVVSGAAVLRLLGRARKAAFWRPGWRFGNYQRTTSAEGCAGGASSGPSVGVPTTASCSADGSSPWSRAVLVRSRPSIPEATLARRPRSRLAGLARRAGRGRADCTQFLMR